MANGKIKVGSIVYAKFLANRVGIVLGYTRKDGKLSGRSSGDQARAAQICTRKSKNRYLMDLYWFAEKRTACEWSSYLTVIC